MQFLKSLRQSIRQNVAGVAAIEFAIILPVLMLLVYGGYEGWRMVLAGQRIDHVAYSVSDLSSRLVANTTEGDLTNMLSGGLFIAKPFDIQTDGRVVLSAINTDAGRQILWQRCMGAGSVVSALGVEGGNANISAVDRMPVATDDILFVTEVSLLYRPPLVGLIYGPITLTRTAVVPGRAINPTVINPGGQASTC
jgi:Flp pilus assembly protein TadG